ncbi:MAG TPA: hypothetical protein VGV65_08530 [Nocardioides sp.]|nr:hypothetical protein [Nocardioides sp.]
MRTLLVVAAVVVSLMGLLLTALPTRTATWFAWTIDEPMTAVFLGSAYVSSAVLVIAGARSAGGAGARLTSWSVLVMAVLTFIVTLVHVDVLHLGGDRPTSAWLVAGGWLATWAAVPLIIWIALRVQARSPSTARATRQPLPRVLRILLLALAVVLLGTGAGLIVSPTWVADAWSWPLTPLAAGVGGASLVGYGWAAGHALLVGDAQDVLPLGWGVGAFVALQSVSLFRHGDDLGRPGWQVWAYLVVLAWACVVSAWILLTGAAAAARESSR